jgi:hypothetical protein
MRFLSLGSELPGDLADLKSLLEQVTITVDSGVVSGSASQPATGIDGAVMPGKTTTLEVRGTYDEGVLEATWTFFRPYEDTNVNGGGYVDSADLVTKDDAGCSLSGTYNRAWSDGKAESHKLEEVTIEFATAD